MLMPKVEPSCAVSNTEHQVHQVDRVLDRTLIAQAKSALDRGAPAKLTTPVRNTDRTVGAMLSGEVALRYGHKGLPDDTIHVKLTGTAGQSFGAWAARGVTLELEGEGNDFVGKGLSGGRLVVYPSPKAKIVPEESMIVGNVALYGAIAGEAYFRGVAAERFAVRNSGAWAVVEGVGDHGCEYMTGGVVVVIGQVGRNFAAGMSGGIAYVYDEDGQFATRCNTAMVSMEKVLSAAEQEAQVDRKVWHRDQSDEAQLKKLLEDHHKWTGSQRARELLDNWATARAKFVKVFPNEYKRALGEINAKKAAKAAKPVAA